MPTYEYRCKECGEHLEVVQSFKDEPLTECAKCGGPLRKVFGNIGISFKGSGFYKTDSRAKPTSDAKSTKSETPAATSESSSTKTDSTKSDAPKSDAPKSDAPKSGSSTKSDSSPTAASAS